MERLREPITNQLSPILLRGALYRALALGLAYPSPDVLERLTTQWKALSDASVAWPDGVKEAFQDAARQLHDSDTEALGPEHVRLFGPAGRCSLHETSYGNAARLLGRSAHLADISGFYLAFGLQPAAVSTSPEDHISIELEFMSLLSLKEAYALAEGWDDHLEVTRDAQRKFVQDHLGTWFDAMAAELRAADPHPFYAALGETLRRLVRDEVTRLNVSPIAVSGPITDPEMGGDTFQCPRAGSHEPAATASPDS
jgi:DMSO reductase family type II enzyme chaperone